MNNIKVIDDWLECAQLIFTKTDGKTKYDFNKFIIMILRYKKQKIISNNYKY